MKRFRRLNVRQRTIVSGFFSTIAVAWFGGGVVTTVFVRPENFANVIYNILVGVALAYLTVVVAIKIEGVRR